jgi:hypothetical protein
MDVFLPTACVLVRTVIFDLLDKNFACVHNYI